MAYSLKQHWSKTVLWSHDEVTRSSWDAQGPRVPFGFGHWRRFVWREAPGSQPTRRTVQKSRLRNWHRPQVITRWSSIVERIKIALKNWKYLKSLIALIAVYIRTKNIWQILNYSNMGHESWCKAHSETTSDIVFPYCHVGGNHESEMETPWSRLRHIYAWGLAHSAHNEMMKQCVSTLTTADISYVESNYATSLTFSKFCESGLHTPFWKEYNAEILCSRCWKIGFQCNSHASASWINDIGQWLGEILLASPFSNSFTPTYSWIGC